MTAKTIKAQVTISRNSHDEVRIEVVDNNSRFRFLRLTMSPHDFAMAVTGLSNIEVPAEIAGLDFVGKVRVSESRSAKCPLNIYNKDALSAWLVENCQEEGWILDTYLGAQSSIGRWPDGAIRLNYRVYRYVEQDAAAVEGPAA